MAVELNDIDHLLAARDVLKTSLDKSRDIAVAINKAAPRLEEVNQQLPALESGIRLIADKCALYAIREHVDRAVGPAAGALKVLDAVQWLENSLSAGTSKDLFVYLATVKRLEEALRFLTDNCKLVILWLEDAQKFLEEDTLVSSDWYSSNVKKSLRILGELQATEERSRVSGGSLNAAYQNLENEFRLLLTRNSFSLPVEQTTNTAQLPLPLQVIQKMQAIIERLTCNNQLERCISIYIEVRSSTAKTTLQELETDYLAISLSEFDSAQSVENCIDQWGSHLEFAVKHLLELEHRLCKDVFQKDQNVGLDVFAKIAVQCGIQDFIKFPNAITRCKKEAIKLFKLLDIFAALDKLRLDFNRLFGGKACVGIQNQMRDLIKKVVNGVYEIFWELSGQVEMQRLSSPRTDGTVPRLVSFVTDYSNHLLDENYRPLLNQVLEIHWSWNHQEKFEKGFLSNEVCNIVKLLEQNLEEWGKTYDDRALSHLFMMNNHWYLCQNLKGTNLGNLLGDSWLRGHEEHVEYYAAAYMKESWGKLPRILSEEGLILFSGGKETAGDTLKKRVKTFIEAFDDTCRKQSNWVVSDKGLRWKMCQVILETVVPVYKSYIQNHTALVEEDYNHKCLSIAQRWERNVSSLFQPKLGKYGSSNSSSGKGSRLISKMKNVVTNHFSSTPAAA